MSLKKITTDRNFISGILFSGKRSLCHFSWLTVASKLQRFTPRNRAGYPQAPVYVILHPIRFTQLFRLPGILVRSYRTFSPLLPPKRERFFSAALAVSALRRNLPVRKYGALWCPDFPSPSFDGNDRANSGQSLCIRTSMAPLPYLVKGALLTPKSGYSSLTLFLSVFLKVPFPMP